MNGFSPFYSFAPFLFALAPVVLLLVLWTLLVKGYALWTAAKSNQKWWFIALLVVNTLGILELVYLIWFSPEDSNRLHTTKTSPAAPSSPQG